MLSIVCCFLLQAEKPRPVRLVVACPPQATLHFDAHEVKQRGAERRLVTPPLPPGRYGATLRLTAGGRELVRRHVEFMAGETVNVSLLPEAPTNFGVAVEELKPAGITLNGAPISKEQALRLLGPSAPEQLPTDGGKRRLTVIGPAEACRSVLAQLEGPLREFAAEYVLKSYRPTDWAVAGAGFQTASAPTIYAQEADGAVLFRQDDPADLKKNLEAVRKPRPDYRPDRDPDYRKTPTPVPAPAPASDGDPWPLGCLALAAGLVLLDRPR